MSNIGPTFIAIFTGVIGLAIVAVLVSQKAQTSNVLQAGGGFISGIIGAAVSPLGGGSSNNQFGSTTAIGGVTH